MFLVLCFYTFYNCTNALLYESMTYTDWDFKGVGRRYFTNMGIDITEFYQANMEL